MNTGTGKIILITGLLTLVSSYTLWSQPANDLPCDAQLLTVATSCSFAVYTTLDATDSGIPLTLCDGYLGGDVWFKIEVPLTGNVIVKLESDAVAQAPGNDGWAFRIGLAVYTGSCDAAIYDTCWIDPISASVPIAPEILLTELTPGDTIFLRVWKHSNNDNGDFRICVFNDEEDPTITCPTDITIPEDPGSCSAAISVPVPVTIDNYGIAGTTNDFNGSGDASDTYPLGTTTVTWTVTDLVGNTNSCTQNITVTENEDPTITCVADRTEYLDDNCQFILPDYTASAPVNDNCDATPLVTQDPVAGTILSGAGTIQPVTLTAEDISGNSSSCIFSVTLQDNSPPSITCFPDTVIVADEGIYEMEVTLPAPLTEDNCGILSVINDFNGGADASGIYQLGLTTVIFTATDQSGNRAECTQEVTVRLGMDIPFGLVISQGISPNGDGLNDTFEIIGIGDYPDNELFVFNIYGNQVYHKIGYDNSWDGKSFNNLNAGDDLPTGTYYYILYLEKENATIKGYVYLKRD